MAREDRRRRGRGRRFLIGLLVALALAWFAYWIAASYIAGMGVTEGVAALSARGGSVTCVDSGTGGFPLGLDLRCGDARLAAPGDGLVAATLKRVAVRVPLYRPGHVEAAVTGPFNLDAPAFGGAVEATWSRADASLDLGLSGLSRVSAALNDFVFAANGDPAAVPLRRLGVRTAYLAAGPAADNAYRLAAGAIDLVVERTGGPAFPTLSGEVALVAENFGGSLGTDPRRTLAAWVARGGALKVERLAFAAGPTSASASGNLVIAPTGLVSGTLNLRIAGLEKLSDLAEALKPGSGEQVRQVVGAISAFTKPAADGAGRVKSPSSSRTAWSSPGCSRSPS